MDLARGRQFAAVDVPLRIPEVRSQEGLRAVSEHLLDLDQEPELRCLTFDRERLEQLDVGHDGRPPVHPQRVADPRDR